MSPTRVEREEQEDVGTALPLRGDLVAPPRVVGNKLPNHEGERGVVQIFFRFLGRSAVAS